MNRLLRIGLLIVILILAVLFFILDPSKHPIFPRCIFYSLTGLYCPGCGSQRAIHSLLHLNFAGVVQNNLLFLPALVAIIYHYLCPILNRMFKLHLPDIFYMKNTPIIIFAVIIIFWIVRNMSFYPAPL